MTTAPTQGATVSGAQKAGRASPGPERSGVAAPLAPLAKKTDPAQLARAQCLAGGPVPPPQTKGLTMRCPVPTCENHRKPWHLLCSFHWQGLPSAARARVAELYRTERGSMAHVRACALAVDLARGASPAEVAR